MPREKLKEILIVGKDDKGAFSLALRESRNFYARKNHLLIGDGKNLIAKAEVISKLYGRIDENTRISIFGHGCTKDGEHIITILEGDRHTSAILGLLSQLTGTPTHITLRSCFGGAAKVIGKKGSTLITMAASDDYGHSNNYGYILPYKLSCLKNDITPSPAEQFLDNLNDYLGITTFQKVVSKDNTFMFSFQPFKGCFIDDIQAAQEFFAMTREDFIASYSQNANAELAYPNDRLKIPGAKLKLNLEKYYATLLQSAGNTNAPKIEKYLAGFLVDPYNEKFLYGYYGDRKRIEIEGEDKFSDAILELLSKFLPKAVAGIEVTDPEKKSGGEQKVAIEKFFTQQQLESYGEEKVAALIKPIATEIFAKSYLDPQILSVYSLEKITALTSFNAFLTFSYFKDGGQSIVEALLSCDPEKINALCSRNARKLYELGYINLEKLALYDVKKIKTLSSENLMKCYESGGMTLEQLASYDAETLDMMEAISYFIPLENLSFDALNKISYEYSEEKFLDIIKEGELINMALKVGIGLEELLRFSGDQLSKMISEEAILAYSYGILKLEDLDSGGDALVNLRIVLNKVAEHYGLNMSDYEEIEDIKGLLSEPAMAAYEIIGLEGVKYIFEAYSERRKEIISKILLKHHVIAEAKEVLGVNFKDVNISEIIEGDTLMFIVSDGAKKLYDANCGIFPKDLIAMGYLQLDKITSHSESVIDILNSPPIKQALDAGIQIADFLPYVSVEGFSSKLLSKEAILFYKLGAQPADVYSLYTLRRGAKSYYGKLLEKIVLNLNIFSESHHIIKEQYMIYGAGNILKLLLSEDALKIYQKDAQKASEIISWAIMRKDVLAEEELKRRIKKTIDEIEADSQIADEQNSCAVGVVDATTAKKMNYDNIERGSDSTPVKVDSVHKEANISYASEAAAYVLGVSIAALAIMKNNPFMAKLIENLERVYQYIYKSGKPIDIEAELKKAAEDLNSSEVENKHQHDGKDIKIDEDPERDTSKDAQKKDQDLYLFPSLFRDEANKVAAIMSSPILIRLKDPLQKYLDSISEVNPTSPPLVEPNNLFISNDKINCVGNNDRYECGWCLEVTAC